MAGETSPCQVTADLVYVRLHGPGADAYTGTYADDALRAWVARIREWRAEGRNVVCFFNNNDAGHAPRDAMRLQTLLDA